MFVYLWKSSIIELASLPIVHLPAVWMGFANLLKLLLVCGIGHQILTKFLTFRLLKHLDCLGLTEDFT